MQGRQQPGVRHPVVTSREFQREVLGRATPPASPRRTGMAPRRPHRLRDNVIHTLARHPLLDARGITVSLRDGVLTLEGHVPDRESRRVAEDVALAVDGVVDVVNRLRVHAPT
ncbi:MAG: BON domain-containing protein [Myxococcota bacterium]